MTSSMFLAHVVLGRPVDTVPHEPRAEPADVITAGVTVSSSIRRRGMYDRAPGESLEDALDLDGLLRPRGGEEGP
jgi:hypothetical protein